MKIVFFISYSALLSCTPLAGKGKEKREEKKEEGKERGKRKQNVRELQGKQVEPESGGVGCNLISAGYLTVLGHTDLLQIGVYYIHSHLGKTIECLVEGQLPPWKSPLCISY